MDSRAEEAFMLILYNLHKSICAMEMENAELLKKSTQLEREVLREERAVLVAEDWICVNEEKMPQLERIVLEEEKDLDDCTKHLMNIIWDTEEVRPVADLAFDITQSLQESILSLHWKLEHLEEVGVVEALEQIQQYENKYGRLEEEEGKETTEGEQKEDEETTEGEKRKDEETAEEQKEDEEITEEQKEDEEITEEQKKEESAEEQKEEQTTDEKAEVEEAKKRPRRRFFGWLTGTTAGTVTKTKTKKQKSRTCGCCCFLWN